MATHVQKQVKNWNFKLQALLEPSVVGAVAWLCASRHIMNKWKQPQYPLKCVKKENVIKYSIKQQNLLSQCITAAHSKQGFAEMNQAFCEALNLHLCLERPLCLWFSTFYLHYIRHDKLDLRLYERKRDSRRLQSRFDMKPKRWRAFGSARRGALADFWRSHLLMSLDETHPVDL